MILGQDAVIRLYNRPQQRRRNRQAYQARSAGLGDNAAMPKWQHRPYPYCGCSNYHQIRERAMVDAHDWRRPLRSCIWQMSVGQAACVLLRVFV